VLAVIQYFLQLLQMAAAAAVQMQIVLEEMVDQVEVQPVLEVQHLPVLGIPHQHLHLKAIMVGQIVRLLPTLMAGEEDQERLVELGVVALLEVVE
jgi:hypothetical protein